MIKSLLFIYSLEKKFDAGELKVPTLIDLTIFCADGQIDLRNVLV